MLEKPMENNIWKPTFGKPTGKTMDLETMLFFYLSPGCLFYQTWLETEDVDPMSLGWTSSLAAGDLTFLVA